MIKYDLLVYLGLLPLVAVIIFSGFVIWRTPTDTDLETRKIRMADAVLVGLLALFIFTAILYFVDPEGAGEEIFSKASPVIFALVGTIVGYIFGTARKNSEARTPGSPVARDEPADPHSLARMTFLSSG